MIVWIYVDTRKQVGDKAEVFASDAAANRWFSENDAVSSNGRKQLMLRLL